MLQSKKDARIAPDSPSFVHENQETVKTNKTETWKSFALYFLRPRLRQGYAEAYGRGERILRGEVCQCLLLRAASAISASRLSVPVVGSGTMLLFTRPIWPSCTYIL